MWPFPNYVFYHRFPNFVLLRKKSTVTDSALFCVSISNALAVNFQALSTAACWNDFQLQANMNDNDHLKKIG